MKDIPSDELLRILNQGGNNIWKTQIKSKNKIDTYYMIPLQVQKHKEKYNEDEEYNDEGDKKEEDLPCACDVKLCSIFEILKTELPWLGEEQNDVSGMSLEEILNSGNVQIATSALKGFKEFQKM